jgi:hypothetical protein
VKQADLRDMFTKASKSACISTISVHGISRSNRILYFKSLMEALRK